MGRHFICVHETKLLSLSLQFLFSCKCFISHVGILPSLLIKLKTHKVILDFLIFLPLSLSFPLPPSPHSVCPHLTHSSIYTHTPFSCFLPCLCFLLPGMFFTSFILFPQPLLSWSVLPIKYNLPKGEDFILVIFAFPASSVVPSTLEILLGIWSKV